MSLSRARKFQMLEAAVPEIEFEGRMEALIGSICCLAAGAHSTNAAEQEQIAATFFNCAMTGFEGIQRNEAVIAFVQSMFDKAKKHK